MMLRSEVPWSCSFCHLVVTQSPCIRWCVFVCVSVIRTEMVLFSLLCVHVCQCSVIVSVLGQSALNQLPRAAVCLWIFGFHETIWWLFQLNKINLLFQECKASMWSSRQERKSSHHCEENVMELKLTDCTLNRSVCSDTRFSVLKGKTKEFPATDSLLKALNCSHISFPSVFCNKNPHWLLHLFTYKAKNRPGSTLRPAYHTSYSH